MQFYIESRLFSGVGPTTATKTLPQCVIPAVGPRLKIASGIPDTRGITYRKEMKEELIIALNADEPAEIRYQSIQCA